LAKITGAVRLGEIVQRARMPEYEVYEIVAQAIESGHVRLVEKRKPRPVAPADETKPQARHHRVARRTIDFASLVSLPRPLTWVLALVFAVLAAVIANIVAPHLRNDAAQVELQELAAAEAREYIRLQIEVHRAAHGRYPRQLGELVQDELVSRELLARVAPLHYTVAPDGSRFSMSGSFVPLESAGDPPPRR
jgi:hypothetical protein